VQGNAARFESNIEKHDHFGCERCGKVEDIDWFDVPALSRRNRLGRRIRCGRKRSTRQTNSRRRRGVHYVLLLHHPARELESGSMAKH
jgi:hypothetical protein